MDHLSIAERGRDMRVSVYKLENGRQDVLVEASPGSGLAPVLIPNVTKEDIKSRVLPVVVEMRRPKQTPVD